MAGRERLYEDVEPTTSSSPFFGPLPAATSPRDSVKDPYFRVPHPPAPSFRTKVDRSISGPPRNVSLKTEHGTPSDGMMQAPRFGNMRDHAFPPGLPSLFTPCFLPGFFSLDMANGYPVAHPHMFAPGLPPPLRSPQIPTDPYAYDGFGSSYPPFPSNTGGTWNSPPPRTARDYERSMSDPSGGRDLSKTVFPASSVIKRAPPLEVLPEHVPRPPSALPQSVPGPFRHVKVRSHRTPAPDSEMAFKSSHAVYAKLNRERRKKYLADLEKYRAVHKKEQTEKRKVLKNLYKEAAGLQEEIAGYRNELMHNKELMALLRTSAASTSTSNV